MEFCYIPADKAQQLGSPKAERDAVLKAINRIEEPTWLELEAEEKRGTHEPEKGFWLGKYPVTQGEWKAVMGNNPSRFKLGGDDDARLKKDKIEDTLQFPVENVKWNDICGKDGAGGAETFLGKVNQRREDAEKVLGKGRFCLPREKEWEYAARGGRGNKQPYYWGAELNGTEANCNGDIPFGTATKGTNLERTCAVKYTNEGNYPEHPWGLRHMSGNVWQWCNDECSNGWRVVRGGSWRSSALDCRAAFRDDRHPDYADNGDVGFRVCFRLD
jgi:formylglycine-generating enzyme required for sulfatase activity